MYTPEAFKLTDTNAIQSAIAANPFASLATNGLDAPCMSHLPLVARVEEDGLALYGHFARANPHWKDLDGRTTALAVFSGAQGYISPDWYPTKRETGKVVPTWNYVVVHARGIPEILDAGEPTLRAVEILTDAMERPRAKPWEVSDAPKSYTESMLRGIVAFRMIADTLEATAKLSQNKTEADFSGAVDGLANEDVRDLAHAMRTLVGSSSDR